MHTSQSTPSKILLFGEYSILAGSQALAIPFSQFSGCLKIHDMQMLEGTNEAASNQTINQLYDFLKQKNNHAIDSLSIDLKSLKVDIDKGLYFQSNIPQQYGLGSSGALTAAIFSQYANVSSDNLIQLKQQLSIVESFFHGSSSGIDPLVCYLKKPVIISPNNVEKVNLNIAENEFGILLIDTQKAVSTKNTVTEFLEQLKSDILFKAVFENEYIPVVNKAISQFCENNKTGFFKTIKQLSNNQIDTFKNLFPEPFLNIAQYGNKSDLFHMKLCGSGGGGFMLAFTQHKEETTHYFQKAGYKTISIN